MPVCKLVDMLKPAHLVDLICSCTSVRVGGIDRVVAAHVRAANSSHEASIDGVPIASYDDILAIFSLHCS